MEQPTLSTHSYEELDLDLRDEFFKSCITRESTKSRRFSASNLTSFREEARSFRHAPTISSTASSPGYTSTELIDPSTYSFTEALKALQIRAGRESLPSFKSTSNENPLHSKWNEAERYICNPLSGQVPVECLSAKALSGRLLGRITMSAPLAFSNAPFIQSRPTITDEEELPLTELESCRRFGSRRILTRDKGTQSSPQDLSSSSNSPDSAPSIKEITVTSCGMEGETPEFHDQLKTEEYEVAGKEMEREMETEKDQEEKVEERIGMFKCKLGSCLGWGLQVKKRSTKRRGSEEPTKMVAAFGLGKVSVASGENRREKES
ncbi:hypothetical protein CKAN_01438800 [Cinnamomum micranthum f. kanehirae]|uniref:Uncharacterized protein n=1 Tax=Cinnamomum micranthum f. kanehirae TaxID=337451 RepID=A0A443P423_9MAGN|nr:hypothetical protein CKAN_01438800 [Cinnamomum micranthum f. kanehirae]